jgi:hypothetical protein
VSGGKLHEEPSAVLTAVDGLDAPVVPYTGQHFNPTTHQHHGGARAGLFGQGLGDHGLRGGASRASLPRRKRQM